MTASRVHAHARDTRHSRELPPPPAVVRAAQLLADERHWPRESLVLVVSLFSLSGNDALAAIDLAGRMQSLRRAFG